MLTCNVPGGIALSWIYNSMQITSILNSSAPSSDHYLVDDNIEFTVSLLSSTGSDLVSEISFEVSSSINGVVLRCSGVNATAAKSREVTLQEENSIGELDHTHTYIMWQSQVENEHYSTVSGLIRLVISLECFIEITPDFLCPFNNE